MKKYSWASVSAYDDEHEDDDRRLFAFCKRTGLKPIKKIRGDEADYYIFEGHHSGLNPIPEDEYRAYGLTE
jgi:hypothetical protein